MKRFALALPFIMSAFTAHGALLNLSSWQSDGDGVWTVDADGTLATQSKNGSPTVFYSNENMLGKTISGQMTVSGNQDDDFVGFVLGYNAGDVNSAKTDFLLIDWKQADQTHSKLGTASVGMSASLVSGGLGYNKGAWEHKESRGVTELARANTLGDAGWAFDVSYDFDITYTADLVEVFINGSKEFSLTGEFGAGSFGFYNFSQPGAQYTQLEAQPAIITPAAVADVNAPATALLFGLAGAAMLYRRRQQ